MDQITRLGELALATRLKRLGDRLQRDVSRVYRALDFDFEARWFPLLRALADRSPQAVTELAQTLGMTHPAVRQIAGPLLRRGLLREQTGPRDARRRLLALTRRGQLLAVQLVPVWREIQLANAEWLDEAGVDLLAVLERLETSLDERSMEERVCERLELPRPTRLRIVDYRPAYKKHFRTLNESWLREYFTVERADALLLADPNGRIIRRGGRVLFALWDGEVVGTVALLRHGADVWELAKMAVDAPVRGRGIGRALARSVLELAREEGAVRLYLQTSPRLEAAMRLYRALGFRRVRKHPLPGDPYCRCTITMRLDLVPGPDRPARPAV